MGRIGRAGFDIGENNPLESHDHVLGEKITTKIMREIGQRRPIPGLDHGGFVEIGNDHLIVQQRRGKTGTPYPGIGGNSADRREGRNAVELVNLAAGLHQIGHGSIGLDQLDEPIDTPTIRRRSYQPERFPGTETIAVYGKIEILPAGAFTNIDLGFVGGRIQPPTETQPQNNLAAL